MTLPPESPTTLEERRSPRGLAALAWGVILVVVVLKIVATPLLERAADVPTAIAADDPVADVVMELQGRYLVGAAESTGSGAMLFGSGAASLDVGPVGQRQRLVVLAGEMVGPGEARSRLDDLGQRIDAERERTAGDERAFDLTEKQAEVQRILGELYGDADEGAGAEEGEGAGGDADAGAGAGAGADAPAKASATVNLEALTDEDRAVLEEQLGWFGSLALNPPLQSDEAARDAVIAPALRTFRVMIATAFAAGGAGIVGFVGLVIMTIFTFTGRLRGGLYPAATHHGIYAETFALWLVLFIGLQIVAGVVAGFAPSSMQMLVVLVAFFASLLALAWPVLRGVAWSTVRRDIGWTLGRRPLLEPLLGLVSYFMTLPILAVGFALTFVLLLIDQSIGASGGEFAPAGGPAHPIVSDVARGDVSALVQILLLGAVAAPIVEETMFRGVLYRHLRDASRGMGTALSIVAGCLINTFVFAIIHPQGYVAVPALMSLAIGFSLVREWRGTVIPAIVMHGVSNGLVLSLIRVIL